MKYLLFWTPEFYSVAYSCEQFSTQQEVKDRIAELEAIDGSPDCLDLDYCVYIHRRTGDRNVKEISVETAIRQVLAVMNSPALIKISVQD